MNFTTGGQRLVDAAFLSHALIRAPRQLWGRLSDQTRQHLVAALKATRDQKPPECNWLLFSAMVEVAVYRCAGETGDAVLAPMAYAVEKHLEWYKGDGIYGDGPPFHWDAYNSFVIQPMLLDVTAALRDMGHPLGSKYELILSRARRYASVQ